MIVKLENNGNGQYVYPIIMSLSSILHFIHLSPCRLLSYCPTSRASIQNGTWLLYRNRVSSHFGEIEYLLTLIGMGMTLVWLNLILGDSSSKKKKIQEKIENTLFLLTPCSTSTSKSVMSIRGSACMVFS